MFLFYTAFSVACWPGSYIAKSSTRYNHGLVQQRQQRHKPKKPAKPADLRGEPIGPSSVKQPSETPNNEVAYRPVFLLVWSSAKFKAHWALFIADAADKTFKSGKYIHVEGNPVDGFTFQIVRGWDINKSRRRPQSPIEIGWVRADLIVDVPSNGQLVKESVPRDQLEAMLAAVPAPARSFNKVTEGDGSGGKRKKPELSDCQWWTTRCVANLVESAILVPPQRGLNKHKDPRDTVAQAPRH
ncbi:unnamed protein product [Zymoseptoria tritici ST99CH_1E4]|uniref:Uncharacterized protein n=1 Tax=Zymoseptoria tritici ST99CH_1E4 TaxID=1276532 RepID=A0A2H1GFH4_ZYMTR|nr:unnamed protein product [Zymoseptoria tritici ST99CH_1E4]